MRRALRDDWMWRCFSTSVIVLFFHLLFYSCLILSVRVKTAYFYWQQLHYHHVVDKRYKHWQLDRSVGARHVSWSSCYGHVISQKLLGRIDWRVHGGRGGGWKVVCNFVNLDFTSNILLNSPLNFIETRRLTKIKWKLIFWSLLPLITLN